MIDFFASDEKLNLSYLIKYIKDLGMAVGLLLLSYFILDKANLNDDIRILVAFSIVFGWIYLVVISLQPFFIIIRDCKGLRDCLKRFSLVLPALSYVVLFAITYAFVIFFKNTF